MFSKQIPIKKILTFYPNKTPLVACHMDFDARQHCSPGMGQQSDSGRTHLSTTTMGLSLPVRTIKPFQIMSAEDTIMAKFKTW